MGAIIWLLLGQSVNYFFVLGVLLVSSIAGVIVAEQAVIGGLLLDDDSSERVQ
ncbi:inner membrane ybhN domain protein, partial [Escherichia coli 97.0007]